jgi:cell division protein FtsB
MRRVMGPRMSVLAVSALALALMLAACTKSETDQQVADLQKQVSDLQAELDQTKAALDASQSANADLQTQLTDTQAALSDTQDQLASTQAELLDAQAQLAKVGELKLADGTYVGPVLGAKASPYRVIVFNAAGLFRVAQVATDVTITAGGSDYTLSQFGKLLSSTDPNDAKLANGNYQVIVKKGIVTSIRKSKK